ncbi:MAG: SagB family peptide dehydrogenase [Pseudomonadota bacterium]
MSRAYHLATAYERQGMGGHHLDWAQRPHPFKRYRNYAPQPLPAPRPPQAAIFDIACAWPPPEPAGWPGPLDAAGLAGILTAAAGLTAMLPGDPDGGGLRAWASAGALFPNELYLTAAGVAGLAGGLYHFAPALPGLTHLWPGATAAAAARPLGRDPARLTFAVSGYYWRSLWKYRTRAYRYCLLDAGHLAANLELACAAAGFMPRPVMDFADRALNVFLGLATDDEAALYALLAGPPWAETDPAAPAPGLPPLDREALALSNRMGRDQEVLAAHAAGELEDPAAPRLWPAAAAAGEAIPLPAPAPGGPDLAAVMRYRRSRRNFIPAGLDAATLARLLAAALPADGPALALVMLGPGGELPAGSYLYLPGPRALVPLGRADRRANAAAACLGQMWAGQASLVLLMWNDLAALDERGGPRTYRHAMLHAGRVGQRLYLAATALGLGCCGVGAFFDRELAAAAGLPAGGNPLYLLACGPVKGGAR